MKLLEKIRSLFRWPQQTEQPTKTVVPAENVGGSPLTIHDLTAVTYEPAVPFDDREYVLVVNADVVKDVKGFTYTRPTADANTATWARIDEYELICDIGDGDDSYFAPRDEVENDPTRKQIIPYILIRQKKKFWTYSRNKVGQEPRLHNFRSLGFGGHVNPEDWYESDEPLFSTLTNCITRELQEELGIKDPAELLGVNIAQTEFLGLLNDSTTDVEKVHLGFVYILDLPNDFELSPEKAISDLQLMTLTDLRKNVGEFENWSKLIIAKLHSGI